MDRFEPVLNETRNTFSRILRNLFVRDVHSLWNFSLLLALGDLEGNMYKVQRLKMEKLKEMDATKLNEIMNYMETFSQEGLVLRDRGDLIVPVIAKEAFESETKGNIIESKIFRNPLDAETFICDELFGTAEKSIKIWDPYVNRKTLQLMSEGIGSRKLQIRILSSNHQIHKDLGGFPAKEIRLMVRVICKKRSCKNGSEKYEGSPFHDRYVFIDDVKVWHFGPSLHGAGLKEAEMVQQLKRDIAERILESFEYNWEKQREQWEEQGWDFHEFRN